MFYSDQLLKKNGRFGLVWLAATQSRLLTKREMCAVDIELACTSILEHFPYQTTGGMKSKRRFSLYLTSQLLYGTAIVLKKKGDFLLAEVWTLFKKCCPEPTNMNELDIVMRHEPMTVECLVPSNLRDKNFDILFGISKDHTTTDIETVLDYWERTYQEHSIQLTPIPCPVSINDTVSSPCSVSDPRDIQIRDTHIQSIDQNVPDDQELPVLDAHNLSFLLENRLEDAVVQSFIAPIDAAVNSPVNDIVSKDKSELTQGNESRLPILEATPGITDDVNEPKAPRKTKKSRGGDSPIRKKKKPQDKNDKSSLDGQDDLVPQTMPADALSANQPQQQSDKDSQEPLEKGLDQPVELPQITTPIVQDVQTPYRTKWGQTDLPIELPQVSPTQNRVLKRQPHNLIIDDVLQISRQELRENISHSEPTCQEMTLPCKLQPNFFKNPGSKSVHTCIKSLKHLWERNCTFGLRYYTDTDTDSISSSLLLSDPEQVTKSKPKNESIELGRQDGRLSTSQLPLEDISIASSRKTDQNQSTSIIERTRDELELTDRTFLNIVPEEQQHIDVPQVEPVPIEQFSPPIVEQPKKPDNQPNELANQTVSSIEEISDLDTSQLDFIKLLKSKMRSSDDWISFGTLCPVTTTSRKTAAAIFFKLLEQKAKKKIGVRQLEAYGEIFVWIPE